MVCTYLIFARIPVYTYTIDGTPATQINRIASHPTMSILVTAHEDKFIRIFDLTTGKPSSYNHCGIMFITG